MSAEETTPFGLVTQLVGPDAAVRLTKALGGRRIYVPRSPGAAHPITAAVGLEAAMALAARFGGEQLEVPLTAERRSLIVKLAHQGLTREQVRARVGCSRRLVYQVLAEHRAAGSPAPAPQAPSPQLGLFDRD